MRPFHFSPAFVLALLSLSFECQCAQDKRSPKVTVERKQLSSFGYLCHSDCTLQEIPHYRVPSSYYTCNTSFLMPDPDFGILVPYWDTCSPIENYDYYGRKCKEPCGFQGYPYQWCWTVDDSWGYCGTTQVVTKVEQPLTIYGETCEEPCETLAEQGTVCERGQKSSKKYCSAYEGYSYMGTKCTSECARLGRNFYWCGTNGRLGWNYCSPSSTSLVASEHRGD